MRLHSTRQQAFDLSKFFAFTGCILILFCAIGCQPQSVAPASKSSESIRAHGFVVDENSSPRQVAELFLAAAKNNDRATLAKLVAIEKAKEDLQRITQGKKDFASRIDNAAKTTVSAWLLSLQFYDARSLTVQGETINESTVIVNIEGKNKKGETVRRSIKLIDEQGLWKVLPGIH